MCDGTADGGGLQHQQQPASQVSVRVILSTDSMDQIVTGYEPSDGTFSSYSLRNKLLDFPFSVEQQRVMIWIRDPIH